VGAGSATRRAIARLTALSTLALLTSALALPPAVSASGPAQRPKLADDAAPFQPGMPPIRDLGVGPSAAGQNATGAYVPGVVLVQFRDGTSGRQRAAVRGAVNARSYRRVSRLAPGLESLTLEAGTSVEVAITELRRQRQVRYAEPDAVITTDHQPADAIYSGGLMWGMYGPSGAHTSTFGSNASGAWDLNHLGSHQVYVGIVDTGIDIDHKDLAPNIWTNPGEIPGNGIDDDGNGYIDDVHGWDFFHDDASVYDSAASDYHGTHVAGTIGAVGQNLEGAVGVNWAVTMIPAKFIDGQGDTAGAVQALDYLTDLKVNHGLDIVATNNSWGGASGDPLLEEAINRGGDAGILFVTSAGNSAEDIDETPSFPASAACDTKANNQPRGYDCLISVAAIDANGGLAGFSNFGATSVDIGAPGVHIASTYPGNLYAYLDGTSMAAPHVTGALALLASCQASPTPSALETSLFNHATATASLDGVTTTGARLNIGAMMADCDTNAPPQAILIPAAGGTDTPATFEALFSETVTGLAAGDFTIGGTSTGWSISNIVDYGSFAYVTLAATSPPVGTLTLTLASGSVAGAHGAGPTTPISSTTLVDTAAPTTTAPVAALHAGASLSGSEIPVALTWQGSDSGTGARFYWVQYSTDGGSTWYTLQPQWPMSTMDLLLDPSGSLRFKIQAYDWAGHASDFETGPTFSPRLVQQSSSSVSYSGAWTKARYSKYSGGSVRYTNVGKRSATYSFTGRAVAFITTISGSRGEVRIKLDGVQVARIDLGKTPTAFRRLAWATKFTSVHAHKIQIVVIGGYGRVDIDAFAVLK